MALKSHIIGGILAAGLALGASSAQAVPPPPPPSDSNDDITAIVFIVLLGLIVGGQMFGTGAPTTKSDTGTGTGKVLQEF